jgi:hypothetical protein
MSEGNNYLEGRLERFARGSGSGFLGVNIENPAQEMGRIAQEAGYVEGDNVRLQVVPKDGRLYDLDEVKEIGRIYDSTRDINFAMIKRDPTCTRKSLLEAIRLWEKYPQPFEGNLRLAKSYLERLSRQE